MCLFAFLGMGSESLQIFIYMGP